MKKKESQVPILTKQAATIEDLYHVSGKAEIVNGEIVHIPPTGGLPGYAGDEVYSSLRSYVKRTHQGRAVSDNKGFKVNLPDRDAFSPDAAYYVGPDPGMEFYDGSPVFAAEVRSANDYGRKAERDIAQKRADYLACGTLVVWDVDLLDEYVIKVYRASDPAHPTLYKRGDVAEAEPAVPGWTMPVDDLFA